MADTRVVPLSTSVIPVLLICLWQITRRFHFETEDLSVPHGGNMASSSDNAHREKRNLVTVLSFQLFYIAMKLCYLQSID
jgi:hypothetical protein